MTKRLTAVALICICLLTFGLFLKPVSVHADETQQFTGEATLLKQDSTSGTFQITVSNKGEDFDGTVRFQIDADGGAKAYSAFDTKMTLPQDGQKQYMITVPLDDYSSSKGLAFLTFLDDKGEALQLIKLTGILGDKAGKTTVGVLSDSFDKLSYLQMPGQTYYANNKERSINLIELSSSDLKKSLSGLYFLVIDDYDMSALDSKQIAAIEDWVNQGGWLIIGTGSRGSDMISAFSKGFLDLAYVSTTEAGTPNEASKIINKHQGDYTTYVNNGVNLQDLAYSEFTYSGTSGYFSSEHPGWNIQIGQGCALVLGISLSDLQVQSGSENIVYSLYDEVQYNSLKSSSYTDRDNWAYMASRALSAIDRQFTDVNFTSLKVLIFLYAILVGPVLYLILRRAKRSEWYWVGIPILGVVFVGLVYLCGNGMQVRGTKMYSVSVQQADGETDPDVNTYLLGYRSGTKEWTTKLNDNYMYAGSAFSTYVTASRKVPEYVNHIVYDGDKIRIGANPTTNFESEYMKAFGSGISVGSIDTDQVVLDSNAQSGSVTNNTNQDFPYLALQSSDYILILTDVKAGETVDIADAIKNKKYVYNQADAYLDDAFDKLVDYYNYGAKTTVADKDVMSALMLGMSDARQYTAAQADYVVATGITKQGMHKATSEQSERAYSCFYAIAEQEGSHASN